MYPLPTLDSEMALAHDGAIKLKDLFSFRLSRQMLHLDGRLEYVCNTPSNGILMVIYDYFRSTFWGVR